MRDADTTSLPQVKQCANKAKECGLDSGVSSSPASMTPSVPGNSSLVRLLIAFSITHGYLVESASFNYNADVIMKHFNKLQSRTGVMCKEGLFLCSKLSQFACIKFESVQSPMINA